MPAKSLTTAAVLVPADPNLPALSAAAARCRACDLWKKGTQTVFGEGVPLARVMMVGEQPGDSEDKVGRPFVGPAGRLLDEALSEAGIDRKAVYVTNAVKHFNWVPDQRGKRRIHKKPRYSEIQACRPWLDAELEVVKPEILVCLGATAAQAILGKEFRLLQSRGKFIPSPFAPKVMATVHPSSILRAMEHNSREQQKQMFIADLRKVARALRNLRRAA